MPCIFRFVYLDIIYNYHLYILFYSVGVSLVMRIHFLFERIFLVSWKRREVNFWHLGIQINMWENCQLKIKFVGMLSWNTRRCNWLNELEHRVSTVWFILTVHVEPCTILNYYDRYIRQLTEPKPEFDYDH